MTRALLLCLPFLTAIRPLYSMQTPRTLLAQIKESVIQAELLTQKIDSALNSGDPKNNQAAINQILTIEEHCRKLRLVLSGASWITEQSEK